MRRFCAFLLCVTPFILLLANNQLSAAEWQPKKGPLMTRWAKEVDPAKCHPEYPRPQMTRPDWINLNGLWDYAIAPVGEATPPKQFAEQILVPFPIESALSGVMQRVGPNEALWYRRTFAAPPKLEGERLLLHFGAVDWSCRVLVNGKEVGSHRGGYDPFTFDITAALDASKTDQELHVVVADPTDSGTQPRGKQIGKPHGIWYTPTTGIWQTVWLEKVPAASIERLEVVPDVDAGKVRITVHGRGTAEGDYVDIALTGREFEILSPVKGQGVEQVGHVKGPVGQPLEIAIPKSKLQLWSPNSPFLYGLRIDLYRANNTSSDTVFSYCAMRKIGLGKDKEGVTRMMLNNEPVFQFGPLDQGFWPDGLYTAPTDEAMKYDLEVTKKLGFNMVRKHVKVEPARWYYYCDQMGLLVWQDMPSGDRYIGASDPDIQRTPESTSNFEREWRAIMASRSHFPCIVTWVPFNEGWGQFDTARITELTKKADPTRLVISASGWTDRGTGDVHDVHIYPGPGMPPSSTNRALVLGEYGGLGLPLEGHTWQAKDNWGYRSYENKEQLGDAYLQLIARLRLLVPKGLSAAVYTQTTDVEVEVNGLMTYDREVLKFDEKRLAAAHAKLYLPPPQVTTIVPTSREKGQRWQYTVADPVKEWQAPDYDDSRWKSGEGGFGTEGTPGAVVRTNWNTKFIWMRREIEIPEGELGDLYLEIHHDENATIYLNGVLAAEVQGYTTDYVLVPIKPAARAKLKPGKNVIAVRCSQTLGGQYIDVGVVGVKEFVK